MKSINESKQEKLPVDFMTQFVSRGWEEVGNLKASIDGIKHEFKDTKKVEDILQSLVDAYLIAIGQMELHLDNKNYVELPEKEELKEALTESNEVEAQPIEAKKFEDEDKTEIFTELPDYDVEVEQKGDKIEIELEPKDTEDEDEEDDEEEENKSKEVRVDADWFVDFDEPDLSDSPLTDKDLYN